MFSFFKLVDHFVWRTFVFYVYFLDSAVFTPKDEGNWMMAKLNVQVTDLGYAQIVEHLAKVD